MDAWLIDKADKGCAYLQEKRGYSLPQILAVTSLIFVTTMVYLFALSIQEGMNKRSLGGWAVIFLGMTANTLFLTLPTWKEHKLHVRNAAKEFNESLFKTYSSLAYKNRENQDGWRRIFIIVIPIYTVIDIVTRDMTPLVPSFIVFLIHFYCNCALPKYPNVKEKAFEALPQGI